MPFKKSPVCIAIMLLQISVAVKASDNIIVNFNDRPSGSQALIGTYGGIDWGDPPLNWDTYYNKQWFGNEHCLLIASNSTAQQTRTFKITCSSACWDVALDDIVYDDGVYKIGREKQVFIDDRFIKHSSNVVLSVNKPTLTKEKLIVPDRPWEAYRVGPYTSAIQKDNGDIELWYPYITKINRSDSASGIFPVQKIQIRYLSNIYENLPICIGESLLYLNFLYGSNNFSVPGK